MANEYQLFWAGVEALEGDTGAGQVFQLTVEVVHGEFGQIGYLYQLTAEVLHGGIAEPFLYQYQPTVEILRSLQQAYSPDCIDDSSSGGGDTFAPTYADDVFTYKPLLADDGGTDFWDPLIEFTAIPKLPAEWNPYRPDVPEAIASSDPNVYDYLREQAELVRDQHNLTQAGDTTYPWEMAVTSGNRKAHTLGALTRFFHADYGLLSARYVKFSKNWLSLMHVFCAHDNTQDEWTVTNDSRKCSINRIVGLALPYENNLSNKYGWVLEAGRAPVDVILIHPTKPIRYQKFTWLNDGEGFVTIEAGPVVGQVIDPTDIDEVLAGAGTHFDPPRWRIPAGAWEVKIDGFTDEYLQAQASVVLGPLTARVTDLEENVQETPNYSADISALNDRLSTVETNFTNELRIRYQTDLGNLRRILDLEERDFGTFTPELWEALLARVVVLEASSSIDGVTTRLTALEATDAAYAVWKAETDATLVRLSALAGVARSTVPTFNFTGGSTGKLLALSVTGTGPDGSNLYTVVAVTPYSLTTQDEGVSLSAVTAQINFAGAGVTATLAAAGQILVTIPGYTLTTQDEAVNVSTATTKINFAGAGVTATLAAPGELLVTIPGGGGGGSSPVGTYGLIVARKTTNQSIVTGAWRDVTWNVEDYDDQNAFGGTTFTVPAGVVAMELNCRVNWENTGTSGRYLALLNTTSGGVEALDDLTALNEAGQTMNTGIIPVTPGHVYKIQVNSGTNTLNLSGSNFGGASTLTVRFYDTYANAKGGSSNTNLNAVIHAACGGI